MNFVILIMSYRAGRCNVVFFCIYFILFVVFTLNDSMWNVAKMMCHTQWCAKHKKSKGQRNIVSCSIIKTGRGGKHLHHNNSPGAVHDGMQAVGNSEDSAVWKLFADGVLNQVVCLQVNSCCGFIQDQDTWFPQQCSGQTQQLPLPNTGRKVICVDISKEHLYRMH